MGFDMVVVNEEKCIHCVACKKVCSILNNLELERTCEGVYTAWNLFEQIRKRSAGGVFGALAEYILLRDGVVYGATYVKPSDVCHILRISALDELEKLQRSKYVQSKIGDTFRLIRQDLDNRRFLGR